MGRKAAPPRVYRDEAHGDVYQYAFTANGKRYRGSTGCRDYGEAQAEAQRLWLDAHRGRPPAKRVRVRDLADAPSLAHLFAHFIDSLTGKKSQSYVDKLESHFRAHFSDRWKTLHEITSQEIERYTTERLRERTRLKRLASSVTVYKEIVTLSQFMKWAQRHGHLDVLPAFQRVKPISDYAPPNYTPEQTAKLLATLPDRHTHSKRQPVREYFTVQWAQALRPDAELGSLRWEDVNLDRGEITIRQSKDKARVGRTIAMAQETRAILTEMAKDEPEPSAAVFGARNFRESLRLAAIKAKLPTPTRHNLRHFRLSELGGSPGTSVGALQFFAGHKHLQTTDRYVRSRTKATRDMLDALPVKPAKRSPARPKK
jgi:integrase